MVARGASGVASPVLSVGLKLWLSVWHGLRFRTRDITTMGNNQGSDCPALRDEETCNTLACQNCMVSFWSDWGSCAGACGAGAQTRTRSITDAATNGTPCPDLTQSQACTQDTCGALWCRAGLVLCAGLVSPLCIFVCVRACAVLVVVVLRLVGENLSLTAAVSDAVATTIVTSASTAHPNLQVSSVTIARDSAASNSAQLVVRATVPVDNLQVGRDVATATQSGVAGGVMAQAVASSAGVVSVTAAVQEAHVEQQNGQLVETVVAADGGDEAGEASTDAEPELVLLAGMALAVLLVLCLVVMVCSCLCGRRGRLNKHHHNAAVAPSSTRRVDLRRSARVVAVGPSSRRQERMADGAWQQNGASQRRAAHAQRATAPQRDAPPPPPSAPPPPPPPQSHGFATATYAAMPQQVFAGQVHSGGVPRYSAGPGRQASRGRRARQSQSQRPRLHDNRGDEFSRNSRRMNNLM